MLVVLVFSFGLETVTMDTLQIVTVEFSLQSHRYDCWYLLNSFYQLKSDGVSFS
jgi:hypothetical protein